MKNNSYKVEPVKIDLNFKIKNGTFIKNIDSNEVEMYFYGYWIPISSIDEIITTKIKLKNGDTMVATNKTHCRLIKNKGEKYLEE